MLLKDGEFNSPTWSQALIGNDPEPWRGDGQHTSHVLTNCTDDLFPTELNVTINTYHLDNMSDTGKFFDLFDHPRSARTNQDKLNVYMAPYPEIRNMDPAFVSKALNGIHYFNFNLTYHSTQQAALSAVLLPARREIGVYLDEPENREFTIWISQWRETRHKSFIAKPGITAEIFADWKDYPMMAAQFWGEVLNESNPDQDDYTRELVRTFLEWSNRKPATNQQKFRDKAKKLWERYKRTMRDSPSEPIPESTALPEFPPVTPVINSGQHEARL
jgi:hypothetical protein